MLAVSWLFFSVYANACTLQVTCLFVPQYSMSLSDWLRRYRRSCAVTVATTTSCQQSFQGYLAPTCLSTTQHWSLLRLSVRYAKPVCVWVSVCCVCLSLSAPTGMTVWEVCECVLMCVWGRGVSVWVCVVYLWAYSRDMLTWHFSSEQGHDTWHGCYWAVVKMP